MTGLYPIERASADERPSAWLLTFADVTALLLAFFVMLFAMSTLEKDKWQSAISRFATLDREDGTRPPPPNATENIVTADVAPALSTDYLSQVLSEKFKGDPILKQVVIHRLDRQVILSLPTDALFRRGETGLTEAARRSVYELVGAIANLGNQIDVYGHTDEAPEGQQVYASNWTLSLARAIAVANEFKRVGFGRNVTILGLGDSRFIHLDSNIPEVRRGALARRVDVVIHADAAAT